MADAGDLKSPEGKPRAGSTPALPSSFARIVQFRLNHESPVSMLSFANHGKSAAGYA